MSRSYRKFPLAKCEKSCKWGKRQANKRIRHLAIEREIPKGKQYKKIYNSWEICDYKWSETWKEYQQFCKAPRWWAEEKEPIYYEYYRDYLGK